MDACRLTSRIADSGVMKVGFDSPVCQGSVQGGIEYLFYNLWWLPGVGAREITELD